MISLPRPAEGHTMVKVYPSSSSTRLSIEGCRHRFFTEDCLLVHRIPAFRRGGAELASTTLHLLRSVFLRWSLKFCKSSLALELLSWTAEATAAPRGHTIPALVDLISRINISLSYGRLRDPLSSLFPLVRVSHICEAGSIMTRSAH
jgi:hypothetical protein